MKKSTKSSLQNDVIEVLFLLIIDFFSIISFWITIPLSTVIIPICKKNINKKFKTSFHRTIVLLSSFFILLSVWIQISLCIATESYLGGIRYAPGLFQKLADMLSIIGN